jgi:hypothetical protein
MVALSVMELETLFRRESAAETFQKGTSFVPRS